MDFISKVNQRQKQLGISEEYLVEKSGISEFTLYYVKHYRQYLTKVAYYTLCAVLDIPVEKNVDEIIEENKKLVGLPETNLEIAAESVNPEYVEKLENEIKDLKVLKDRLDTKDLVINSQRKEIESLTKELQELKSRDNDIEKEAYSKGIKDGLNKIRHSMQVERDKEFSEAERKYKAEISKLEETLDKEQERYYEIFKHLAFVLNDDIKEFPIPLKMSLYEIQMLNSREVSDNEA